MSPCFTLSPQMLTQAFPFHFAVDRNFEVVQAGEVLQRLCFGELLTNRADRFFHIRRPKVELTFEAIQRQTKSLFILELLQNGMQLKGQMMYSDVDDLLFFLGSPWVTETTSLAPLGIKLKDFAIHDPIVDFLFLLQTKNTALNETKKLTEELTQQQYQLQHALTVKENLARIAEAQANRLEQALNKLHQTQAQLVQTEKMSGLGQMVAGVAHEINNPINFIHGNLQYIQQYSTQLLQLVDLFHNKCQLIEPEIANFIEQIDLDFLAIDLPKIVGSMNMGTERIREIVASLRNFSRLDEAEHKVVDLHDGINSTLLILKHRLKAHGDRPEIQVIKHYGDLPPVECYAGQLNQVFMNLLSNAIDALEEWTLSKSREERQAHLPKITITTDFNNDDQIVIKITDNGPGIPVDIQSRLFDPFFTTKPVGKGTGLGLSISYQIVVEKHGGTMTCSSKPGHGTEFCIMISRLSEHSLAA